MSGYRKRKHFHKLIQTDSVISHGLKDWCSIPGTSSNFLLVIRRDIKSVVKSSSFLGIKDAENDHSRSVTLSVYNNLCFISTGFELVMPVNRYAEIMGLKLRSHQCRKTIYICKLLHAAREIFLAD